MDDKDAVKEGVTRGLEQAKEEANEYSFEDLRSGSWFPALLRRALDTYSGTVNAQYFEKKYPGLNRDAIVDRRIDLAKRYAGLAGGVSATAYSVAVAATIGSKGAASPLTVPAAFAAFSADLFFVSKLQLQLAYDLSVLYGHPANLDDSEDLIALVRIAFGVKAGEQAQQALVKLAPDAAREGIKAVAKGPVLVALKGLPVVGKYLLQRNIIKFAIPAVTVPLSAGMNYFMTGRVAKVARQMFRDRGLIDELAADLAPRLDEEPLLFLKVLSLVVRADKRTSPEEAWLLQALADELSGSDAGSEAVDHFRQIVDGNEEKVLRLLASASGPFKKEVFEAACVVAAIDHKYHREEKRLLERMAAACDANFDPNYVKKLIKQYAV